MENIANDLAQITALARTLQPLRDLKAILPIRDSLTWGVDEHIHRHEYEYLVDVIDIKMNYSYWFGRFLTAHEQVMCQRHEFYTMNLIYPTPVMYVIATGAHREISYALLVAYKRFNVTVDMSVLLDAMGLIIPHLTILETIPNLGLELSVTNRKLPQWHIRTWNGVQIPIIEYDGVTTRVRYHDGTTVEQSTLNEAVAVLLEHLRVQNTLLPLS